MKVLLTIWILAVLIQEVVPSTLVRLPRHAIKTEKSSSVQTEYEAKYEQKGKHGNESFSTLSGKQHFVHGDCSGNWNSFADKCASLIKDLVASLANVVSSKPGDATNLQLHIKNTFRHFDNTNNCSCFNNTAIDLTPLLNNISISTASPGANTVSGDGTAPEVVAANPVSQGGNGDNTGSGAGPGTTGKETAKPLGVPQKQVKPNGLAGDQNLDPTNVGNLNDPSTNNRRQVNYPQVSRQPGNGVRNPSNGKQLPLPLLVTPRPAKISQTPAENVSPIPASPVYTGSKTPAVLLPDDNSSGGNSQNNALPASSSNKGNGMPSSASQLLGSPGTGQSAPNIALPVTVKPNSNSGVGAPSSSGAGEYPIKTSPVVAEAEPVNRNQNKSPVAVPVLPVTGAQNTKPAVLPIVPATGAEPTKPAVASTVPVTDTQNKQPVVPAVITTKPTTNTQNTQPAVIPAVTPVVPGTETQTTKPVVPAVITTKPTTNTQNAQPAVIPAVTPVVPVTETQTTKPVVPAVITTKPTTNTQNAQPAVIPAVTPVVPVTETQTTKPVVPAVITTKPTTNTQNAQPAVIPAVTPVVPVTETQTTKPAVVPAVPVNEPAAVLTDTQSTKPAIAVPVNPVTTSPNSESPVVVPVKNSETSIANPVINSNSNLPESPESGSEDEKTVNSSPIIEPIGPSPNPSSNVVANPAILPSNNPPLEQLNLEKQGLANGQSGDPTGLNQGTLPVIATSPEPSPLLAETPMTNSQNSGDSDQGQQAVTPVAEEIVPAVPVIEKPTAEGDTTLTGNSGDNNAIPVVAPADSTGNSGDKNAIPIVAPITPTGNSGDKNAIPVVAPTDSTGNSGDINAVPVVAPIASTGNSGDKNAIPVVVPTDSTGNSGDNNAIPVVTPIASTGNSGDKNAVPVVAPIASTGNSGDKNAIPVVAPTDSTGNSGDNNAIPVVTPIASTGNSGDKNAIPVVEPTDSTGNSGNNNAIPAIEPTESTGNAGDNNAIPVVAPITPTSNSGDNNAIPVVAPTDSTGNSGLNNILPVITESGNASPVLGQGEALVAPISEGQPTATTVAILNSEAEPTTVAPAILEPVGVGQNGNGQTGQSGQAISPAVLTPLETEKAVTPILPEAQPTTPAVVVPASPVVGGENGGGQSGSLGQGGQTGVEDPALMQPTTFQTTSGNPTPPSPLYLNPTETSKPTSVPPLPQKSGETLLAKPQTSPQTPVFQEDDDEDCCSCESCTEEEVTDPKQFKDAACKNLEEARMELKRIIDKITKKLKCGRKAPQTVTTSIASPLV